VDLQRHALVVAHRRAGDDRRAGPKDTAKKKALPPLMSPSPGPWMNRVTGAAARHAGRGGPAVPVGRKVAA
jgi:hypothetical protein